MLNFKKIKSMARIETKDGRQFCCKTKTYKKLYCTIKDGKKVLVNFDKLFITGTGEVRALIEGSNQYVSLRQIKLQHPEDEEYLKFITKEFKIISKKFQKEKPKKPRYQRVEVEEKITVDILSTVDI
ncbi:MAG: hypothetical protein ACOX6C_01715 [Patescibacteria group bacterium]|jgi:hypothetical protein